jgi:hypothetical protein
MMTTLITVLTLILVAIVALWAAWPRLRVWIEQPKYEVLRRIREYEDAHAAMKPPSEVKAPGQEAIGGNDGEITDG